jgi:hypothetical protein
MFRHSTNTASFFSVLMAVLIFSLSGGGRYGAGQHQSGNRRASEQYHGHLQYRHRTPGAL